MAIFLVSKDKLNELLHRWAETLDIQAPVARREGFFDFARWERGQPIRWDYDLAWNSLKRFLLPPEEDLVHFDRKLNRSEPVFDPFPRLLLGVHPYDAAAIRHLDAVMSSGRPDVHYQARREALAVFGLTPQRTHPAVFWPSLGVDDGLMDALWTLAGENWVVETGTPRGLELLGMTGELPSASPADIASVNAEKARAEAAQAGLRVPWREVPELLRSKEDSPLWKAKADLCLSCGACVLVCPTCACFDIQDEVSIGLLTARRMRVWDGCMLRDFALTPGGTNLRETREDRFRHRFKHKFVHLFERHGELACTGCGRCSLACPAGIAGPDALLNALRED